MEPSVNQGGGLLLLVHLDCLRRFKWPMLSSRIERERKYDATGETARLRARAIASAAAAIESCEAWASYRKPLSMPIPGRA
jgi:hypothetical protein